MAQDISEADILSEVVAPDQPGLPPESARSILELAFTDQAKQRMDELAEKNRQGTVTDAEQAEMEKYLRVRNFINLMQAKARRSLRALQEQDDWNSVQRGLKDREHGNELPIAEADAKIREELGFPPRV